MVGNKKKVFVTTRRMLDTPSWERNISEHDVIQHKNKNEKYFFLYHKLGRDMKYK